MSSVLDLGDLQSLSRSRTRKAQDPENVFGSLKGLLGVDELQANRAAISDAQFAADSQHLDGQQLAAKTAGRLIGQAFARLGPDAAVDRAKSVDEAVAAAREQTGFEVPQALVAQMKQKAQEVNTEEAQEAATTATRASGASNLFDQEYTLVSNTMQELVKRGLASEATDLIPRLKAIETARGEEAMQRANLEGKQLSNISSRQAIQDFRTGKTNNIVPRGAPGAVSAQIFHDGRASYWDADQQKEVWLKAGEYVKGDITGTVDSFNNKQIAKAVDRSIAFIDTMGIMANYRQEIIDNPDGLTVASQAAGFMNQYIGDIKKFQSENWLGRSDTLNENRTVFETALRKFNITDQLQRGAVERMAYALAASREGGKLSVSDVEFAMRAFGGDERDPAVRLAALDTIAGELKVTWETFGGIEGMGSNPIYNRAGTFFDAYEVVRLKAPGRTLGSGPVKPGKKNDDGSPAVDAENTHLFEFDDGVTINVGRS